MLPGQKLVEAVVTEAGKSLVRVLERLVGASKWVATKEAEAEAAAMAIKTQAEIQRERALTNERRKVELEEIEYRSLRERRLIRLRYELAWEQANLESIAVRALKLTEQSPNADKGRDIDEDWMFAFARFAQVVSDKDVQELWARILSSAAMAEGQKLSAAALQTMSLLDKKVATDFRKFCAVLATFTFYPAHDRCGEPDAETQNIDLVSLTELGLIHGKNGEYSFLDFSMGIGFPDQIRLVHADFALTRRGSEIANAVFRDDADLKLSEELEQKYLQDVISNQMNQYHTVSILPPPEQGELIARYVISLTHPRGPAPVKGDFSGIPQKFSMRLERLLEWAASRYDMMPKINIAPPGPVGDAF
jgi:Protein of unknown function (DUF2806)